MASRSHSETETAVSRLASLRISATSRRHSGTQGRWRGPRLQDLRHPAQHRIALDMAACVIDPIEMIDIAK